MCKGTSSEDWRTLRALFQSRLLKWEVSISNDLRPRPRAQGWYVAENLGHVTLLRHNVSFLHPVVVWHLIQVTVPGPGEMEKEKKDMKTNWYCSFVQIPVPW
jgi:hypothetical protein